MGSLDSNHQQSLLNVQKALYSTLPGRRHDHHLDNGWQTSRDPVKGHKRCFRINELVYYDRRMINQLSDG